MNTLGNIVKITSFGESHGPFIGAVLDGIPSGLKIDLALIELELDRRKPGQSAITTARKEEDRVQLISGLANNITTGAPICILIANQDARSSDYDKLADIYRPSHADFTYHKKYGIKDYKGGGRSSARITAAWVAAGAIAKMYLSHISNVTIRAFVNQIAEIKFLPENQVPSEIIDRNIVRCPDESIAIKMINAIENAKKDGDSLGGIIRAVVDNCPIGLGEPLFGKLNAALAHAMFSINAVKGFQIGGGFDMCSKKGSEVNDEFYIPENITKTKTNFSGGIQGGISNGMPIIFDVGFKPTSTILKPQNTINTANLEVEMTANGRHDPCVVPRAVPIVEAMAALVIADFMLLANKTNAQE